MARLDPDTLMLTVNQPDQRSKDFDLTSIGPSEVVRQIGEVLVHAFGRWCRYPSVNSIQDYMIPWRHFLRTAALGVERLEAITVRHIERFDTQKNRKGLLNVIRVLRWFEKMNPGRLPVDIVTRLDFVSIVSRSKSKPKDAYSSVILQNLQDKTDATIERRKNEIVNGLQERTLILSGHAPVQTDRVAQLRSQFLETLEISKSDYKHIIHLTYTGKLEGGVLTKWLSSLAILGTDVVPFAIALALRLEIPIECIMLLRRNCLKNERKGFVDIEYTKNRARGREIQLKKAQRDKGLSTPGGLIRLILTVTQLPASILAEQGRPDAEYLFVAFAHNSAKSPQRIPLWNAGVKHWLTANPVHGDGGERVVTLDTTRLRKSSKERRYRQKGGYLEEFADDHTVSVAAKHYANIPALRHEHDTSIELAQLEAFQAAMGPRIITVDEEDKIRNGEHEAVGISREDAEKILIGENDTWLATCLNFEQSPYATDGDDCPVPFEDCLFCANAVFTKSKLKNVLRYLAWTDSRRQVMTESRWMATHGKAHAQITVNRTRKKARV